MCVDAGLRNYIAVVIRKRVRNWISDEHSLSILSSVDVITTLGIDLLLVDQVHIRVRLLVYQMLLRVFLHARGPLVYLSSDTFRHWYLLVSALHVVHLVLQGYTRMPHHCGPVLLFVHLILISVEAVGIEVLCGHADAVDHVVVHGVWLQVLKMIVVPAFIGS